MQWERLTTPLPAVGAYPPRSEYRPAILKEAIYLDTETSHIEDKQGWIYQWAFDFCGCIAYGRKPSELMAWLRLFEENYHLREDLKMVIFVHNLSYDIQYLKSWILEIWPDMRILCTSPHKFITFEAGPFIFRCTYRLSGRSLAKWGSDLGVKNTKKSGMIDYDVIRYQDTPLVRRDWIYQIYDIKALRDCVAYQNELECDTIMSMPLTATAYVRRDGRRIFKRDQNNRKLFLAAAMDVTLYKALHLAYAGGLTHGNRFLADIRIDKRGAHGDFMSHYPTQQRVAIGDEGRGYPAGKFALLYQTRGERSDLTLSQLAEWGKERCLLIQIKITDIEIKKGITLPYAQSYKFWQGRLSDYGRSIDDNGRVLKALGSTIVTLTELDLKHIMRQYRFDYQILRVWSAPRGPLPAWLCKLVDKYFFAKTDLKYQIKLAKEEDNLPLVEDLQRQYNQSKSRLNGIYGMTATNPVRQEIVMDELGEWSVEVLTDAKIAEKLAEFYESKNSIMTYAFGVYCTALARDELMTVVSEVIGYPAFWYADTDSAFFEYSEEIMRRIDKFNKERQEHAKKAGAYIIHNKKRIYYDRFDIEEDNISCFKFLHAKAYAFIHEGKLHCTIAGVTAKGKKGKKTITREQELGGIDELKEDKVFTACGGTRCVYTEAVPHVEDINGHATEIAGAAIILPTEKTMHGLISKDEGYIDWEALEDEASENSLL